jgi:hypothetical protein
VVNSVGSVATEAFYDVANEEDEVYCNEVESGWYSPFTATQLEEIGEYVKTTAKTYADQYVVVANGNATLDLTKLSVSANDVVGVKVDGKFVEWSVDGSTLTYATTVGEKTLTVATTKGVYNVAMVQADNVITTWAEYNTWAIVAGGGYNSYEYTVLASDITAPSGALYTNGGQFSKTFDGLGHTIDGFTCGHGIVQRLLAGGTWKNVNYTNLKTTGQGLFGYLAGGKFENITISGTIGSEVYLFAYGINAATTFTNCTFTLNSADNAKKCVSNGSVHAYGITFNNCTLNYSGEVNYQICTCTGQYTCNGGATKITLNNSTINSNYVG